MTTESERLVELLREVKQLAREYYELTEKPLGVTAEIAEYEVARILGLKLSPARQPGYDSRIAFTLRVYARSMVGGPDEREWLRELADGFEVIGESTREFERDRVDPFRGAEWVASQRGPRSVSTKFFRLRGGHFASSAPCMSEHQIPDRNRRPRGRGRRRRCGMEAPGVQRAGRHPSVRLSVNAALDPRAGRARVERHLGLPLRRRRGRTESAPA